MAPIILYKYASASTARAILENNRLRWSSPKIFNDLAEFNRMPQFIPTLSEAHHLLPQVVMDAIAGIRKLDEGRLSKPMQIYLESMRLMLASGVSRDFLVKHMRHERDNADERVAHATRELVEKLNIDQARVLCLTPRFDNEVMWGNYAGSHTGCVLGFRHIAQLSTPLQEARKISYSADPPVVGSGLDFMLYGSSQELQERTLNAVFFSKKSQWSYEEEWRVLAWRPAEVGKLYGDYLFYLEELESITLGARIRGEEEDAIVDTVSRKYPSTTLYRMEAVRSELHRVKIK